MRRRDEWLQRWGRRSWNAVGIAAAAAIVYVGLAAISGLVIPLIVSTVLTMLFAPLTDRLERSMPRALAAGLVLAVLVALSLGAVAVAVNGVVDQAPEIGRQLAAGIDTAREWLDEEGWLPDDGEVVVDDLGGMWSDAAPGATT